MKLGSASLAVLALATQSVLGNIWGGQAGQYRIMTLVWNIIN